MWLKGERLGGNFNIGAVASVKALDPKVRKDRNQLRVPNELEVCLLINVPLLARRAINIRIGVPAGNNILHALTQRIGGVPSLMEEVWRAHREARRACSTFPVIVP